MLEADLSGLLLKQAEVVAEDELQRLESDIDAVAAATELTRAAALQRQAQLAQSQREISLQAGQVVALEEDLELIRRNGLEAAASLAGDVSTAKRELEEAVKKEVVLGLQVSATVATGAQDRASPNCMGLASFGLEIGIFCDFLHSVLLFNVNLGAIFLRASPIPAAGCGG